MSYKEVSRVMEGSVAPVESLPVRAKKEINNADLSSCVIMKLDF